MSDLQDLPAYPQDLQGRRGDDPNLQGMSLLDYFAGQALIGFMLNHNTATDCYKDERKAAEWSYSMSLAMMNEREKLLGEK